MANKFNIDIHNKEEMEKFTEGLLLKMKEEKKSLKEVLAINDHLLEEIYSYGYTYYDQGRYKEALSVFYFLAGISPKNSKYLFGVGSCFHQMEEYADAIIAFWMTLKCDPKHVYAAYYLSDCLLKQNNTEAALEILDFTIELAGEKEETEHLKERCLLIKKSLKLKI